MTALLITHVCCRPMCVIHLQDDELNKKIIAQPLCFRFEMIEKESENTIKAHEVRLGAFRPIENERS